MSPARLADLMSLPDAGWDPVSWRDKPIKQGVEYEDNKAFKQAISELNHLPPLVTPQEIIKLKNQLREVAMGNAFLLQGGDCAELFSYCNQEMIESKIKLLLQMSIVITYGGRKKVVRVARMAGQYAKPRSSAMETVNGVKMSSYRGDILNSFEADPEARKPDPNRLVKAYHHSSATLNYLRASLDAGLADLHAPLDWSLGHVLDPELRRKYQEIVTRITDTLDFTRVVGIDTGKGAESVDIFSSHEGLLLEYESALTRLCKHPKDQKGEQQLILKERNSFSPKRRRSSEPAQIALARPSSVGYYNTSAHFVWIGDRTRQLDHAHIEYCRGIANPIGVKVGPTMPAEDIIPLLDILNPNREVGKIVLITRYGAEKIAKYLPGHIRAVQESHHHGTVVWQCDPMHGNGRNAEVKSPHTTDSEGQVVITTFKTRRFEDILSELKQAMSIHKSLDSYLGGVHLELTGDDVTECVGGATGLMEDDLSLNYTTFCDPRLNEKQALELAFLLAENYREDAKKGERQN